MSTSDISILIVDDESSLRDLMVAFLGDHYECATAANAYEAMDLLRSRSFNVMLSDITMPGLSGLELCKLVHETRPETVVVMVSGVTDIAHAIDAMRFGAFDYVTKPFDLEHLMIALRRALQYQELLASKHRHEELLEETVRDRTLELQQANQRLSGVNSSLNQMLAVLYSNYRATVRVLVGTLEARDYETRSHSERVVAICLRLGREMGLTEIDMVSLGEGALLHDIGKIAVPDAVLLKQGPLTDDEWRQMREHVGHGLRIIEGIDFLAGARPIVGQHHEKYDGSGYPGGLVGESIHIYARIFAVADAFDALMSDRPYRMATGYCSARSEIVLGSGSHFDPEVVKAFVRVSEQEWLQIRTSPPAPDSFECSTDKERIHSMILSLCKNEGDLTRAAGAS
jgi:putative nucleotidyltransferase with HDIG domain